jgi:UrcA family protein
MRISTPILAAPVMLVALCFGAHADTPTDGTRHNITGRSVVHYGDLNLSDEQDAGIMLRRIEGAAKTACGGHATANSLTGSMDHATFDECRAKAVERAVKQLSAPAVTRIYSEAGRKLSSDVTAGRLSRNSDSK